MAILNILGLITLCVIIAYLFREHIIDTIPVSVSLLILVLYVLAFMKRLSMVDIILPTSAIGFLVYILMSQSRRTEFLAFLQEEVKTPAFALALIMLIAVPVLTSAKAVTWWDDFNFWATDVKSLYFLDGFAGKYHNVAPEFGDYPPATQLIKWFFVHMDRQEFRTGLMFAGYYFCNMAFLCPILKNLRWWNVPLMILMPISLWLFPSVAEVFSYDGCCADMTMAAIYACFLVTVTEEGHRESFYYIKLSLLLACLILCKNTGAIWVLFGLIFLCVYKRFAEGSRLKLKNIILTALLPVIAELSWLIFCLVNRRVAKLTGAAVRMATGVQGIPDVNGKLIEAFIKAFIYYPLHRWSTWAIDLSPLALFVLLIICVVMLTRAGKLTKREGLTIGIFMACSGIVFYAFNLISHLTIFAVEEQYLDPFGMVSSIERYGAPFTIGSMYLIASLAMRKVKTRKLWGNAGVVVFILFVMLTCDYNSAYRGLIGYREDVETNTANAESMIDEEAKMFLQSIGAENKDIEGRVLYIRDVSDISWVRSTYINFFAAPMSVMYANVDGSSMTDADIIKAIDDAHAEYIYSEKIANDDNLWDNLVSGDFVYSTLYKVNNDNGVFLSPVNIYD